MEIRAIRRRQIYREPYTLKFNHTFHYAAFKNKNMKSLSAGKSAVIVIMREDQLPEVFLDKYNSKKKKVQLQLKELWCLSSWQEEFNENIFLYQQQQKPVYKEAVYFSGVIKDRLDSKVFDEVFLCFKTKKRNIEELNLLKIFPVEPSLSFLLPKYLESIIFGILLEAYAS